MWCSGSTWVFDTLGAGSTPAISASMLLSSKGHKTFNFDIPVRFWVAAPLNKTKELMMYIAPWQVFAGGCVMSFTEWKESIEKEFVDLEREEPDGDNRDQQ